MIINTSTYTSAVPVALSDTINIPGPKIMVSGTTTSLTSNKLVDTNGGFTGSVHVGMVVYNMAQARVGTAFMPSVAVVTSIDSNTQLSLSADIFTAADSKGNTQKYQIYDANGTNPKAAMLTIGTAGNVFVKTIDGDEVLIPGVVAGETLSVVVQRVLVGAVGANGAPDTRTTAEKITAYI